MGERGWKRLRFGPGEKVRWPGEFEGGVAFSMERKWVVGGGWFEEEGVRPEKGVMT